jgi:glycosyltransferase involved in cell wall biosynthesis
VSKIVFLLSQSLDSPSGLGRYAPLARELAKLGHSIDIFALHPSFHTLKSKYLEEENVRINYVAPMHVKKSGDRKSYYSNPQLLRVTISATWRLSQAAVRQKADIIHIGKPHPMNSIAGLLARKINHCDLYLDCDDFEAGSGRFTTRWQKSIITWFEKWMPHKVNAVTTNTRFMHDKIISWRVSPNEIIYLPNGVDRARFSTPDPREVNSLRTDLNFDGKKVVGYIGSLSIPSHPVNILLEAFQKLNNLEPNTTLMLVGGGEDIDHLKNLGEELEISHVTRFCGRVSPEKVPLYYSLADVAVDPVYDNDAARGRSPLKLFESWVCGVPIVCGDVGDRRQLLGDPPAGVLTQPGNPDELAKAILSILENPMLAAELRQRGLERVNSYTWDNLAMNLNKEYLDRTLKVDK